MKRPMLSAISKFSLGVAMAFSVMAGKAQTSAVVYSEKNAEVKYLGNSEDAVLFNISYSNPNSSKFFVTVLDAEGTTIYQGSFTDKKFDKRFRLPVSEKNKLTFVIRNAKAVELKETFEINTRYVEDVVVTKI
jgi:hypothetical protein